MAAFRSVAMPLSLAAHGTLIGALVAVSLLRSVALPEPSASQPPLSLPVILAPSPAPGAVVLPPRAARSSLPAARDARVEPLLRVPEGPLDSEAPSLSVGPEDPIQGCSGCLPSDVAQSGVMGGDPAADGPPIAATLRVGSGVEAPRKVRHVAPVYPDIARQARVQGTVTLECTIDPRGRVASTRVLSGPPLLEAAALDAVRQWTYTPTRLNGVPVAVILTVTVRFELR